METPAVSSALTTVTVVFKDFRARRSAIITALTRDVDQFYELCNPRKENLCLYGHPNGMWEVTMPAEDLPHELPEPALGINFSRDRMERRDWLFLVAVHSDSWLLAVAFYMGMRFDENERKRLFRRINDLPTVYEVVYDREMENYRSGLRRSRKRTSIDQMKYTVPEEDEECAFMEEEDEYEDDEEVKEEEVEEDGETLCGMCSEKYNGREFWVRCDRC